MINLGFYTNFEESQSKRISYILTALAGSVSDYAIYYEGLPMLYNHNIPAFHSANLINFTGQLITFTVESFINACKNAYKAEKIVLMYGKNSKTINPIDILYFSEKSARIVCEDEDSIKYLKRILGNNIDIVMIDRELTCLTST